MTQIEIALEEFQRQLRMYDIFRQFNYDKNFYYDVDDDTHSLRAYSFISGVVDGIVCMITDQELASTFREAVNDYLNALLKAHFKMHNYVNP